MSLTAERMMKLMAYADGELDDDERAEVEGWLETDADAIRFANEVVNLGVLVNAGHRDSPKAKAIASFDIADALMAAVEKEETPARVPEAPAAPVVSLEARRQARLRVGGAVVAALALAASVFILARSKEDAPMARAPVPANPVVASAEPGVDVELDETESESVRVFYLANESSPTTSVVVWVDEPGGK